MLDPEAVEAQHRLELGVGDERELQKTEHPRLDLGTSCLT
jgi:hypothetical protein